MSWWEKDPRYGRPGWTVVHDDQGSRFVRVPKRKRRKAPRALRFAEVKVGDVLIHRSKHKVSKAIKRPVPVANDEDDYRLEVSQHAAFWVVEHRWFDPCQGQHDRLKGEMVGVCPVNAMGKGPTAYPHTLRGLAMQGFDYATPEQAARVRAFMEERRKLIAAFEAGEASQDEVRMRSTPYRELVRGLA